jgi:hypothetical protein
MSSGQRLLIAIFAIAFAGVIVGVTTFAIERTMTAFASRGYPAYIQARAAIEKRERDAAASPAPAPRLNRRQE